MEAPGTRPRRANKLCSNHCAGKMCPVDGFVSPERALQQWLWRHMPVITAIRRLSHKDHELEASLSYTGRP